MRRTARRWLARAALCLALGLATTVAVAWGLAAWLPHTGLWSADEYTILPGSSKVRAVDTWECGRIGMRRRTWRAERWTGLYFPLGDTTTYGEPAGYEPRSGPLWAAPLRPDPWADGARGHGGEDARGWPWLALWCEVNEDLIEAELEWRTPGGLLLSAPSPASPWDRLSVRTLPLRPLWPGLLADTGVYALAWGFVLFVPGWVKRARRRAKGRCTGCGYDRAGLAERAACPECGAGQGSPEPVSAAAGLDLGEPGG